MSSYRFIHCADVHVDRSLKGVAIEDETDRPDRVDRLRVATRVAFANLVGIAISERVAFLVIAGDLYDEGFDDYSAARFFVEQMKRLHAEGIRVYLLYGNHDAESERTKTVDLPPNVFCFAAGRAQTYRDPTGAALHGRSFPQKAVNENLAAGYPPPVPGALNIGVLHTALSGKPPHGLYAPCTVEELRAKQYDMWALGHVHSFEVVSESPWIVYPGNLQGLHVRECGARGAVLVTVDDDRIDSIERIYPDIARWFEVEIDVTGAESIDVVAGRARPALQALIEQADGRDILARVQLVGSSALERELERHRATDLLQKVRAVAPHYEDGLFHVVDLKLALRAPPEAAVVSDDAIHELQDIINQLAADPEVIAQIEESLVPFLNRCPPDVRAESGENLGDLVAGRADQVVGRVAQGLAQKLLQGARP